MGNILAKTDREQEIAPPDPQHAHIRDSEQECRNAYAGTIGKLQLIWCKRLLLTKAMLWGLLAATIIAFLIPKYYMSNVKLMPPESASAGVGLSQLLRDPAKQAEILGALTQQAVGVGKPGGSLFVDILRSNRVEDELIDKFHLQRVYGKYNRQDTRDALVARTGISQNVLSGVVTISVTDRDPQRAATMAQEYIDELNWVVAHLSTSAAHRERVFLDQRLGQVKQELDASEAAFSEFASKNTAIDISQQGKAMVTAAATLQGQLLAAESELEGLRQIYAESNVRVRSTEAQVNKLRNNLRNLTGNSPEVTSAGSFSPSLRELAVLGVPYADLLRRVKINEAVFEALTQQKELAKVNEAKEIPSVTVFDPPQVPETKSFPPRLLIVVLGTALTLAFAIVWILVRLAWQATDVADPRKALAVQIWSDVHASLPWNARNGSYIES
jgi:capsule polysaccharide export protein KpsE/RkpR